MFNKENEYHRNRFRKSENSKVFRVKKLSAQYGIGRMFVFTHRKSKDFSTAIFCMENLQTALLVRVLGGIVITIKPDLRM